MPEAGMESWGPHPRWSTNTSRVYEDGREDYKHNDGLYASHRGISSKATELHFEYPPGNEFDVYDA